MPVDVLNRYAVHFSSDSETLWFTLDKQYLLEKWRGIKSKYDIRHLSESLEEFTLKLGVDGLSIGRRSTYIERISHLVKYFMAKANAGNLKSGDNFSAEVYEIKADTINKQNFY